MRIEDDLPQEEVPVEEGVDPRDPGVPVSLVQIAARPNEALEIIESRVAVLTTIRIESIRRHNAPITTTTTPTPMRWICHQLMSGK